MSVLTSSSPIAGEKDGQPKDAARAEKLCGIGCRHYPRWRGRWRKDRTQIIAGWCVQRMQHGEQWSWMVVAGGNVGQIGLPGGGFGFAGTTTAPTPAVKDHFKRLFRFDDRSASTRQHGLQSVKKASTIPLRVS